MAATHRRRAGWAGAAGVAGALLLGAPASPGTAQAPPAEAPHGQLLQAPDGTLYLLVAGRAHPITPAPLTAEAHAALAAAPPGEAFPDGAFWLVPAAAPPPLASEALPAPTATPARPAPAVASTQSPAPALAPFFATQTRAPGTSAFFATQTAVAPTRSQGGRWAAATATPAVSAAPRPGRQPAGQS
jgi:hypothetical protein